jgi:hypothetical protein
LTLHNNEKYTIPVPYTVRLAVMEAYKLRDIGFKGGSSQDWKRAKQLITHKTISIEDLRSVRQWYMRNVRVSYPDYDAWEKVGKPTGDPIWYKRHGIITWITCGSTLGLDWINSQKNIDLLNDHFDKEYTKIQK